MVNFLKGHQLLTVRSSEPMNLFFYKKENRIKCSRTHFFWHKAAVPFLLKHEEVYNKGYC